MLKVLLTAATADALLVGSALRAPVARSSVSIMTEPVSTCFYAVYHEFKKGKAEAWWDKIENMENPAKAQHSNGIYAHNFLPSGVEGPILCIWECEDLDYTPKQFQAFIDGPDSPAGDALINKPYQIVAGNKPASAWPKMPAVPKASTGSFFWIYHKFVNRKACTQFWEQMADMDMDAFEKANREKGFHNHFFLPTGFKPNDPVFCVWESKEKVSIEDFQAFIDGPDGPAPGVFDNKIFEVMPGGTVPSSAFPKTWMEETMEKIEKLMPFSLDEIKAKIGEATK